MHADVPSHQLHDLLADGEPESGAAEPASGGGIGLREGGEESPDLVGRNADAGVGDLDAKRERIRVLSRAVHRDEDVPRIGELDRVPGEVEQHLPNSARVADDPARRIRRIAYDKFDVLLDGSRREQLRHLGHGHLQVERNRLDGHLAGLDLGEVEDVVNHAHQELRRVLGCVDELTLLRRERGVGQQAGHAEHTVHRRADLVGHRREKLALRLGGGLGLLLGSHERDLGGLARRDVDADDGKDARLTNAELRPPHVDVELAPVAAHAQGVFQVALQQAADVALPGHACDDERADRRAEELAARPVEVALRRRVDPRHHALIVQQEQAVGRGVHDRAKRLLARVRVLLGLLAQGAQPAGAAHAAPRGEVEQDDADAEGVVDATQGCGQFHRLVLVHLESDTDRQRLDPGPGADDVHAAVVAIPLDVHARVADDRGRDGARERQRVA